MATDIRKDTVPDNYKYGWHDADAKYENKKRRGLTTDVIREISQESGWESATFSFDQYVGQAMAKVRAAMVADEVDALLDDIDSRVASSVLRHSLFSAAREVADADHARDDAEESLLGQLAARFG